MSLPQILDTVIEALQDPAIGFRQAVERLAEPVGAVVRSDFNIAPWSLPGETKDTRTPNIVVTGSGWKAAPMSNGVRFATATIEIGYECFSAESAELEANVTLACVAVMQVVDALRDYSDRTGGTIVEILDTVDFRIGDFAGLTTSGFLASFTLSEWSTQ